MSQSTRFQSCRGVSWVELVPGFLVLRPISILPIHKRADLVIIMHHSYNIVLVSYTRGVQYVMKTAQ